MKSLAWVQKKFIGIFKGINNVAGPGLKYLLKEVFEKLKGFN